MSSSSAHLDRYNHGNSTVSREDGMIEQPDCPSAMVSSSSQSELDDSSSSTSFLSDHYDDDNEESRSDVDDSLNSSDDPVSDIDGQHERLPGAGQAVQDPSSMVVATRAIPLVSGMSQVIKSTQMESSACTSARREERHRTSTVVEQHQTIRRTSHVSESHGSSESQHLVASPELTPAPITSSSSSSTGVTTAMTFIQTPGDQIGTSIDRKGQKVVVENTSNVTGGGGRVIETRTTTTKQIYSPRQHTSVEMVSNEGQQQQFQLSGYGQQSGMESHHIQTVSTGESSKRHAEMIIRESNTTTASSSQMTATEQQHTTKSESSKVIKNSSEGISTQMTLAEAERLRKKEEKRRRKEELKKEMIKESSTTATTTGGVNSSKGTKFTVVVSGGTNKATVKDYLNHRTNNDKHITSTSTNAKTSKTVSSQDDGKSISVQYPSKKTREYHPGVNYGFQTDDLRYITIPSERGIDLGCHCDLLWKSHYSQELYGAVQLQSFKKKRASQPGVNLGCGDGIIHGVRGSKGDVLYAQMRLKQSTSFGASCGDGSVRLNRKSKTSSKNASLGDGRVRLSSGSSGGGMSSSVGLGGGRIQF